ncbi:MAG TPA: hypothetical protein DIT04_10500 [Dysgonomonas sp.]|nr:hypothetical protein [Dysgonomonas sp.]
MKKLLFALTALFLTTSAFAKGKPVNASNLPEPAKAFITTHFGGLQSVYYAELDGREYEVDLRGGYELEFNRNGSLKSVEADWKAIPASVLNEVPASVSAYINSKFAGWKLVEISIKSNKIEVELEKGRFEAELKFSSTGRLLKVEIDD